MHAAPHLPAHARELRDPFAVVVAGAELCVPVESVFDARPDELFVQVTFIQPQHT